MTGDLDIEQQFSELDESETVMKEYYIASNDPKKLQSYIDDKRKIRKNIHCYVPGVVNASCDIYTEQYLFHDGTNNISVSRHLRYTPEFTHMHTVFEIIYVLKGECTNTIRSDVQLLKEGDFCIITPNVPHSLGVFSDSLVFNILIKKSTFNETFFKLLTKNNMLSEFFMHIIYTNNTSDFLLFHTEGDGYILSLMRSLITEGIEENDDYTALDMESLIMLIFSRLLRRHQSSAEIPPARSDPQEKLITDILRYIDENYKTVSLSSLAEKFSYTTAYMSRMIKKCTGRSFSSILLTIRLERACVLLTATDMTVNEIALSLGYESAAFFHRSFRKAIGLTPIEYRQGNKK